MKRTFLALLFGFLWCYLYSMQEENKLHLERFYPHVIVSEQTLNAVRIGCYAFQVNLRRTKENVSLQAPPMLLTFSKTSFGSNIQQS